MPRPAKSNALKDNRKAEGLSPHSPVRLDQLKTVRTEMGRLYRLWLNGKLKSDEMTKGTYVLKEIRACIEAEVLDSLQQRLTALALLGVGTRG